MTKRTKVFISYSHADSNHLARLKTHLKPFERDGLVETWSDSRIVAGQKWRDEIKSAISQSAVAILLVSADFLASDFIAVNELPPLLAAAEKEGLRIISVILKKCAYEEAKNISCFQAINDPAKPLIATHTSKREALWYQLAKEVANSLQPKAGAAESATPASTSIPLDQFTPDSFRVEMISGEVKNPKLFEGFHVYSYEHVDCEEYMPLASEVLSEVPNKDAVLKAVSARLSAAGWEGDGELRLMWLPPFLFPGIEDTWGLAVWFVKQGNNGTAWIASSIPLPFQPLLDQQS